MLCLVMIINCTQYLSCLCLVKKFDAKNDWRNLRLLSLTFVFVQLSSIRWLDVHSMCTLGINLSDFHKFECLSAFKGLKHIFKSMIGVSSVISINRDNK